MAVRDFVFALCVVEESSDGFEMVDFLGTGFLIGNRSFALTAAHVVNVDKKQIMAMFVIDDKWRGFSVKHIELHPSTDVALLKIEGGPTRTPFRCRNKWEGSSSPYKQWGYPAKVAWEGEADQLGKVWPNPELIYFQGYIRRRFTRNLAITGIKGTEFFEVSEQAGRGCSGSPLWLHGADLAWEVIGIYSAERTVDDLNAEGSQMVVAYAVREDAFRDWQPALLGGRTILEESLLIDPTVN